MAGPSAGLPGRGARRPRLSSSGVASAQGPVKGMVAVHARRRPGRAALAAARGLRAKRTRVFLLDGSALELAARRGWAAG